MNILFLPLNKKETRWGLITVVFYIGMSMVLEAAGKQTLHCILVLPVFAGVILFARRFWTESLRNIPLTGKQLIWKPLLATLVCKVICFLVHDLFLLLGFSYFVNSDWGPILWDIRGALLEDDVQSHFWLVTLAVVALIPMVEEFVFRGVLLGTLYPKHSILAVILSVGLFVVFHTLPYAGAVSSALQTDGVLYLCLYAFQFIPMGLFLTWLYISTDSIFAPTLMHMIFNYALVF